MYQKMANRSGTLKRGEGKLEGEKKGGTEKNLGGTEFVSSNLEGKRRGRATWSSK